MSRIPDKYVVIFEIADTGYMDVVGVYENSEQAYGAAYLTLCEDINERDERYSISLPEYREGENGMIIESVEKTTGSIRSCCTVLFHYADMRGESDV